MKSSFVVRKQKYFYHGELDWDVRSPAGKYVRSNCKPLKVRDTTPLGRKNKSNTVIHFVTQLTVSICCFRHRSVVSGESREISFL